MSLIHGIRKFVEQLTNTRIYRRLPHGVDCVQDISHFLPNYQVKTVFDVGANVGQSMEKYLTQFPHAKIHCFEPTGSTFKQLLENVNNNVRVNCYQVALSSSESKGKMVIQGSNDMFYLLDESKPNAAEEMVTETVDVLTMDQFCQSHQIEQISYLKIDTEGGDLEVLKGAVDLLSAQKIDFVEVEAGMSPINDRHVAFEELKSFLESHNYYLFGIYEQVNEWPTNKPNLRRTNPVFISQQLIDADKS